MSVPKTGKQALDQTEDDMTLQKEKSSEVMLLKYQYFSI